MLTIGLTGGIACGKSIVSHYFEQLGIPIIDTDIIAKQLVEPGQTALTEITQLFGKNIVDENNNLKRKQLRNVIFKSLEKRQQLETILHPKIQVRVLEKLTLINNENKNNKIPYCIIVIPLLFETKSNYPIDRILLVNCSEQQQIKRTMLRDNITQDQSQAIIRNQVSRAERLNKSDDIIENNVDLDSCYTQLNQIHQKYLMLAKKD